VRLHHSQTTAEACLRILACSTRRTPSGRPTSCMAITMPAAGTSTVAPERTIWTMRVPRRSTALTKSSATYVLVIGHSFLRQRKRAGGDFGVLPFRPQRPRALRIFSLERRADEDLRARVERELVLRGELLLVDRDRLQVRAVVAAVGGHGDAADGRPFPGLVERQLEVARSCTVPR